MPFYVLSARMMYSAMTTRATATMSIAQDQAQTYKFVNMWANASDIQPWLGLKSCLCKPKPTWPKNAYLLLLCVSPLASLGKLEFDGESNDKPLFVSKEVMHQLSCLAPDSGTWVFSGATCHPQVKIWVPVRARNSKVQGMLFNYIYTRQSC